VSSFLIILFLTCPPGLFLSKAKIRYFVPIISIALVYIQEENKTRNPMYADYYETKIKS
jgi:hypothetical protein